MKITLLLILSFISLLSCNKTKPELFPSDLIGKWYYTQDTLWVYEDGKLDSINNTNGITFNHTDYLQFNSNGTCSAYIYSAFENFDYVKTDSLITFEDRGQYYTDLYPATIQYLTKTYLKLLYKSYFTDGITGKPAISIEKAYFNK